MILAAAWLYAHSRTQRSSSPVVSASSAAVTGSVRSGEGGEQPQLVAEMDHPGGDRTAQLGEQPERVQLQQVGIGGAL